MQSNADRKESTFWINRQKAINKGFSAGFEKQKDRLQAVEDNVEMLSANFTGIIYRILIKRSLTKINKMI